MKTVTVMLIKLFRLILFAVTISILFSCSASWHLKRAIKKGAMKDVDTVFVTKEVVVPEVRVDTVLKNVNFNDTIVFTKERVVTKVKVNTVTKEVFVQTICPPDTVRIEVPVSVTNNIKAGKTGFEFWLWIVCALCVGAVLSRIFWKS